ncbi:MAG: DUF885 domain-containing protein [Ruthenibacterium sp.]|nr:DUF885 domain-containing protein [Oscillospiraceae bacterium]
MKHLKKAAAAVLAAAIAFSLAACRSAGQAPAPSPAAQQQEFDDFLMQDFISTMESEYTALHVYLQNPAAFGVDMSKVRPGLGSRPDIVSQRQALQAAEEAYGQFLSFDRSKLTAEQQDTYDIYEFQTALALALGDEKFDYYAQLFESMGGLHYQLPTLLADWALRSEEDVKGLVAVVQDVLPYVESALEYTKEQQARGLLMIDFDEVLGYCRGVLESGEDSAVLSAMNGSIDALGLAPEKAEEYKRQLKDAFTTSFLPAYGQMVSVLEELQASGTNNEKGLAAFEHGREYYELLMQASTGSDKTVEEVRTMMERAMQRHIFRLQEVLMEAPDTLYALYGELPATGYDSYEAILDDIQSRMFEDFPEVSGLAYDIFDLDEEIASTSGITAYFNIPTLDGEAVRQLRVNPLTNDVSSIATYSTVAHEGFPGHMYQYAYLYENVSSPWRKALADCPAYTEGYATYAQYAAFSYLDSVDSALLQAYRENEMLTNCAVILADIGIHYDGWTLEEMTDGLSSYGLEVNEAGAEGLYRQLQANPCAFQPYYVGYEELLAMRESAQQALGGSFAEEGFHEAILKSGAAPFYVVQRNVDAYISEASGGVPAAA